jgi:hypothetical protein
MQEEQSQEEPSQEEQSEEGSCEGIGQEKKEKSAAKVGRQGNFLWQGVHKTSKAKLHLVKRADRAPLLVLCERGKQILCCRISLCGAPYCTTAAYT